MIKLLKEYRLYDDENCTILEVGDEFKRLDYWVDGILKNVTDGKITDITEYFVHIETQEYEDLLIEFDDIESWF